MKTSEEIRKEVDEIMVAANKAMNAEAAEIEVIKDRCNKEILALARRLTEIRTSECYHLSPCLLTGGSTCPHCGVIF